MFEDLRKHRRERAHIYGSEYEKGKVSYMVGDASVQQ